MILSEQNLIISYQNCIILLALHIQLHVALILSLSLSLSLSAIDTALSEFRKSLASELLSGYISCTDCGRSSRSVFGSEAQSSLSLEP